MELIVLLIIDFEHFEDDLLVAVLRESTEILPAKFMKNLLTKNSINTFVLLGAGRGDVILASLFVGRRFALLLLGILSKINLGIFRRCCAIRRWSRRHNLGLFVVC